MAKYGEDYFNPLNINSQNGQTHSNDSAAICQQIVWVCLTILCGWHLIVIVVFKSCCHMVTIWRSFSAVTNAVVAVNDCWQAIILSADVDEIEPKTVHKDKEGDC